MINTIDQLGTSHELKTSPSRIISLVPSITELICDLGLQNKIVGCTKFCVHPDGFKKKTTLIGGTKKVDISKVISLQPDLIIANKEENERADIVALRTNCPVWVSDIHSVESGYDMVRAMGDILDVKNRASEIIKEEKEIIINVSIKAKRRVAYLIWRSPFMTIGADTYIHDMLQVSGFVNVFGESLRYPMVTIVDIKMQKPDVIFLSSEPFPFKERHANELKKQLIDIPIVLVDGEYFSWYGSRILHCKNYITNLKKEI